MFKALLIEKDETGYRAGVKNIDDAHWIVGRYEVVRRLGQQRSLTPISCLNEPPHRFLPVGLPESYHGSASGPAFSHSLIQEPT